MSPLSLAVYIGKKLMNENRRLRYTGLLLLGAALLLRAAIPVGYMPSAAGTGLLFEFCPENVPAGFMQMLAGDHGHHSHHDSHDDNHHCPVGHLLSSAIAVGDPVQFAPVLPEPELNVVAYSVGVGTTASRNYYSRAPPA